MPEWRDEPKVVRWRRQLESAGCTVELSPEEYVRFDGSTAGEPSEHEHILTALKTAQQVEREALSMQVLLGLWLFEKRRRGEPLLRVS